MNVFINFIKISVALVFFSQAGYAELNSVLFKHISEQFRPEYQHYSPIVGKVALERCLIYNLRFFGHLEKRVGAEGRREYAADKGNDSLMQLLILLFPSSAGELTPISIGDSNFGRYATPEMVAQLLNYAHECRMGLKNRTLSLKDLLQSKGMGGSDSKKVEAKLKTCIEEFIATEHNPERNPQSLYPTYTTEQVILAFFCRQFNTKEEVWRLLYTLNREFLDRTDKFGNMAQWDIASINKTSSQYQSTHDIAANPVDLDFLFINNFVNLASPIPYKNKTIPISNGNCPKFDRSKNTDKDRGLLHQERAYVFRSRILWCII
jgi:hypothetical protein